MKPNHTYVVLKRGDGKFVMAFKREGYGTIMIGTKMYNTLEQAKEELIEYVSAEKEKARLNETEEVFVLEY